MGLAASQSRLVLLTGRNSNLQIDIEKNCEERMQTMTEISNLSQQCNDYEKTIGQENNQISQLNQQYEALAKEIGASVSGGVLGAVSFVAKKVSSFFIHLFGGKTKEDKIKAQMNQIKSQAESVNKEKEANQAKENQVKAKIGKLQNKDKNLEMKSKMMETQQKGVSTELDSVQKIIDKDVQASFKTFG